ncbi:hypothetical protein ACTA71_009899 [Dictyostelium dimigraforme]
MENNEVEMNFEDKRYQSIQEAEKKILEMAKVQLTNSFESLKDKADDITKLFDDCIPTIPTNKPPIYTLVTVLNLLLKNEYSTFMDSRKSVCLNGNRLLEEMKSFNVEQVNFHCYSLLKGYFENVEDDVLNSAFVYEEIEKYGQIAIDLYEWIDSNFTIISVKYSEDIYDDEM